VTVHEPPRWTPRWTQRDEHEHRHVAVEAWWWWGWSATAHGDDPNTPRHGVFVGCEVRGDRFDYWAGLVSSDRPYLYVEELDGIGRRANLEFKPPEMWAGHSCDAPFRQWSLGNEAHGVWLDDPWAATHRPYGDLAPCTFDIEWYANGDPQPLATGTTGSDGYAQAGDVDVRIELIDGLVEFEGPAHRVHVWGTPYVPSDLAVPHGPGALAAPYRRHDGRSVRQVLTRTGFVAHTVDRP
jgi:hypothetical protein